MWLKFMQWLKKFAKLKPQIVLGVAAHADDLDYWAAGTLAKWAAAGAKVYLLILTDGSKGTSDPDVTPAELIATRQHEQRQAAKILGFEDVFFAEFVDGKLKDSNKTRRVIVRYIRMLKPDVVVGWDPEYWHCPRHGLNHPDHRAAGAATHAAVYPLSRDHLSFRGLLKEGLRPHAVRTLLMINPARANFTVGIGRYVRVKAEALAAHTSQNFGSETQIRKLARATGRWFSLRATETFVRIDQPF
jgi:LmbE family N-acetylglucosaminyl deacetylase